MKKVFYIILFSVILLCIAWLIRYYYQKNNVPEETIEVTQLFKADLYKNTLATGSIRPSKEVKVKSVISGILEELYHGTGSYVEKGTPLAKIKVIPNAANLSKAQEAVKLANINYNNALNEYNRNKGLYEKGIIPKAEFDQYQYDLDISKQSKSETLLNLDVIKNGAIKNSASVQNVVQATISGTILELGALEGDHVTETNTFSEGTTIVSIADLSNVYFSGIVDESEVGKLEEGMPVMLSIGALEDLQLKGQLTFIAPKGAEEDGAVKFTIHCSIEGNDSINLRAGYSANAEIVLDSRENVWCTNEGNVIYENDSTFVEVQISTNEFKKQYVETGLSDGINIEIISGIDSTQHIKVLN